MQRQQVVREPAAHLSSDLQDDGLSNHHFGIDRDPLKQLLLFHRPCLPVLPSRPRPDSRRRHGSGKAARAPREPEWPGRSRATQCLESSPVCQPQEAIEMNPTGGLGVFPFEAADSESRDAHCRGAARADDYCVRRCAHRRLPLPGSIPNERRAVPSRCPSGPLRASRIPRRTSPHNA